MSSHTVTHPAKFTDALLPEMAAMLRPYVSGKFAVLDPFAGTGKIHGLADVLPVFTAGIEIEPEWADMHPQTHVGNALNMDWQDGSFHAVVTSPTYGNRMADCHEARDNSPRNTYRHKLGRKLHADNSGGMQWGPRYQEFHVAAWTEARRVLAPGGLLLLNIKDHYRTLSRKRATTDPYMEIAEERSGKNVLAHVHVTRWHIDALTALGFAEIARREVQCPGNRHGANAGVRADYESLIMFRLEAESC